MRKEAKIQQLNHEIFYLKFRQKNYYDKLNKKNLTKLFFERRKKR